MKPHSFIHVVQMWCSMLTDPILGCFENP
jgi:hypothetical protein